MAEPIVDVLLLLALPASGKSEVRKFLLNVDYEERVNRFHMGDTVQLDDFPYVHFFRVVDQAFEKLGLPRRFYHGENAGFQEGRDWGTLLHLVNDDFEVVSQPDTPAPSFVPEVLFDRIDGARAAVGAEAVFSPLSAEIRSELAGITYDEAMALQGKLFDPPTMKMAGKTLVIEFARGGPQGSPMPMPAPHGYGYSLAQLHPDLLARAAILYIEVTPEQSFAKNRLRAVPGKEGDVILHAAPDEVMRNDYGACDMAWLVEHSDIPDTVRVESRGRVFHLPIARIDNRIDKTTFVRADPETWDPAEVATLKQAISEPMGRLWTAWRRVHG